MAELAAITFVQVMLRAIQQLNVMHDKYTWVPAASFGMAACEVLLVVRIVEYGFGWAVVAMGVGGATGALVAMALHKRIRNR